jgi:hypothetical protein
MDKREADFYRALNRSEDPPPPRPGKKRKKKASDSTDK